MKIDSLSSSPLSPNQPDPTGQAKNSSHVDQGSRVSSTGDRADLSDRGRILAKARVALANTPDVNQEKVASIKKQVDNGTYSVPASELARRLLHRINQIPPE
jgi:negative regulator of flagellin synthesis FlgM